MLGLIFIAPFLLLLVLFTLSNAGEVQLGLWPTDLSVQAPLSVAVLIASAVFFHSGRHRGGARVPGAAPPGTPGGKPGSQPGDGDRPVEATADAGCPRDRTGLMGRPARVKICGINDPAAYAAAAAADWVGFVFFPPSPRFVTPDQAAAIARPGGPAMVGLFVDPTDDDITAALTAIPLDVLQILAKPDRAAAIRARFGRPVWHVAGVSGAADLPHAAHGVDGLLLDAKAPVDAELPGGNATTFDWDHPAGLGCAAALAARWRADAVHGGGRHCPDRGAGGRCQLGRRAVPGGQGPRPSSQRSSAPPGAPARLPPLRFRLRTHDQAGTGSGQRGAEQHSFHPQHGDHEHEHQRIPDHGIRAPAGHAIDAERIIGARQQHGAA